MQEIRRVSIGKFQRNIYKELKNLPFIITKDGEDYCEVNVPKTDVTTTAIDTFQNYHLARTSGGKFDNIKDGTAYKSPNPNYSGLDPLPEDGTNLAISPTGKCEAPNTNCKGIGKGYRVTFMTDEGEKKKDVFLCAAHVRKAKDSGTEVQEIS